MPFKRAPNCATAPFGENYPSIGRWLSQAKEVKIKIEKVKFDKNPDKGQYQDFRARDAMCCFFVI